MIAAVVQARMGSVRLPGKVLLDWGESELLNIVVSPLLSLGIPVWIATTTLPEDNVIEEYAFTMLGVDCYRHEGDVDDVLGRFLGCIDQMPETPDAVLRVCADRPFINATYLTRMIRYWNRAPGLDYLAPPVSAHAFAGEIVSVDALRRLDTLIEEPFDREHVTSALDGLRFVCELFPVSVDTRDDYDKLRP